MMWVSNEVRQAYAAHLEKRANRFHLIGEGVMAVMNRKWANMARNGHFNQTMLRAENMRFRKLSA